MTVQNLEENRSNKRIRKPSAKVIAEENTTNAIENIEDSLQLEETTSTTRKKRSKKSAPNHRIPKSTQITSNNDESDDEPDETDNLDPLLQDEVEEAGISAEYQWTNYNPVEATKLKSNKFVQKHLNLSFLQEKLAQKFLLTPTVNLIISNCFGISK